MRGIGIRYGVWYIRDVDREETRIRRTGAYFPIPKRIGYVLVVRTILAFTYVAAFFPGSEKACLQRFYYFGLFSVTLSSTTQFIVLV
jgi:hypothetical protein